MRKFLKEAAIEWGVYGGARNLYRAIFNREGQRHFNEERDFYSEFISPGDLCFDVGANIGAKTEIFLALGARVIAFEPLPECRRELMARCRKNARLTVLDSALGSSPGEATFYVGHNLATSSCVEGWGKSVHSKIRVPVTTLDKEIARFGTPRFCKIDVEGFEWEVFKGLSTPLPQLSLEYHLSVDNIRQTVECIKRISAWGELEFNITLGEKTRFCWANWLNYEQFLASFPARAPRSATCSYGDIFVRRVS